MLYDPSTSQPLQAWLVKTLEPICDAEPEALAVYIIALLKHDVPEHDLKEEIVKQLDEFFENGATGFVDTLFAALRSKSYVPYTTGPPPFSPSSLGSQDTGIPIPLDALMSPSSTSPERGTKRPHDGDDREASGPPKGPRLNNDTYFSRQGNAHVPDNWQRRQAGDAANGTAPQGPRVMLPKGVCRDYHLKGFCSRGAMCKYTHDEGAFAPQMPLAMAMNGGPMPFMGMYGGMPFPGAPMQYDPSDPRMDMNQQGYHSMSRMPRSHNGISGGQMFQEQEEPPVIQDLTPGRIGSGSLTEAPLNQAYDQETSSPSTSGDMRTHPDTLSSSELGNLGTNGSLSAGQVPFQADGRPQRGTNPAFRRRGRGGRGTFTGEHQTFGGNESGRNSKTIVVEKIPDDKLSLEAVNNWFKRFGTVTNVAVDPPGKKALVSFSSHEEARTAWSAEEAVFNNRFVKIFWHRPMEGQGLAGQRALKASASFVANIASKENGPAQTPPDASKPVVGRAPAASTKASTPPKLTELQEKQELLEKQIAEQKELMGKLSSASPEEKKEILARLRKLNAEMKTPAVEKSSSTVDSMETRPTDDENKDEKAKTLPDTGLDVHTKNTEESPPTEGEDTHENLQKQLEKLRAEASALGITDDSTAQPYQAPYRGYRGRGRGRGRAGYRGFMRGGPPRTSMKLDNRPKALLVKGVAAQDAEVVQAVRSWFEAGGQLASLDLHDDESLIARFNSRPAAEQALAKGPNIPSAGTVKLSWHSDTAVPRTDASAQNVRVKKTVAASEDRPPSPHPEETPDEIGWGNEEDDGMGMGRIF